MLDCIVGHISVGCHIIAQMPQGLVCSALPLANCDSIVVRLANYCSIDEVWTSLTRFEAVRWWPNCWELAAMLAINCFAAFGVLLTKVLDKKLFRYLMMLITCTQFLETLPILIKCLSSHLLNPTCFLCGWLLLSRMGSTSLRTGASFQSMWWLTQKVDSITTRLLNRPRRIEKLEVQFVLRSPQLASYLHRLCEILSSVYLGLLHLICETLTIGGWVLTWARMHLFQGVECIAAVDRALEPPTSWVLDFEWDWSSLPYLIRMMREGIVFLQRDGKDWPFLLVPPNWRLWRLSFGIPWKSLWFFLIGIDIRRLTHT